MTGEEMKRLNLVALLGRTWGMSFRQEGGSFVALSPFQAETKPSFYVACAQDGHWVYCDHSTGGNGTVIDLMMEKLQTRDFGLACAEVRRLAQQSGLSPAAVLAAVTDSAREEVDWQWLHDRLRANDASPCRSYLVGRGLDEALVDALIAKGVVVLNVQDASRYCCFAVRDSGGGLRSLSSRKIDGPSEREKFLLGRQHPFCTDWGRLPGATAVYICEAIIDALSLLTLRPDACVLAIAGAHANLSKLQIPAHARLVDAFDADEAGRAAGSRLQAVFAHHKVERFDLMGAHDVNEFLQRGDWMSEEIRGTGKLSPQDRIAIALSDKPSRELASKYGIHHSYICDIRREANAILSSAWVGRRPGRKPDPAPPAELQEKDRELAEMKRQFDLLTMRKDWLQLQLKFNDMRDAQAAKAARQEKRKKKPTGERDDPATDPGAPGAVPRPSVR